MRLNGLRLSISIQPTAPAATDAHAAIDVLTAIDAPASIRCIGVEHSGDRSVDRPPRPGTCERPPSLARG